MKKTNSPHTRAYRRYVAKPPTDAEEQNTLANEMLEWVSKDSAFALEQFPISKNMAPSRFYRCAEINEYFSDALDLARYIISLRLQEGLRKRELDKDYVLRLLPLYHQEYKALLLDKVRQSHEQKETKIVVHMDPIPTSDLVPPRKMDA